MTGKGSEAASRYASLTWLRSQTRMARSPCQGRARRVHLHAEGQAAKGGRGTEMTGASDTERRELFLTMRSF
eukprot:6180267-Pleurochrysis_carterae.AAC.1